MMDFKKEIKDQVHVKIRKMIDQFVEDTDTLTRKSLLMEVYYKLPQGDIRNIFNRYIDLIWAAYVAKFSILMQSVMLSVNRDDFITYGLLGRSMVEHAAVLRYFHKTHIVPNESLAAGNVDVQKLPELIKVLDNHLRGGLFDWNSFLNNDFNSLFSRSRSDLKQVRVGKCIEDWAKDDASINILYDLFCDLVHPNLGSTLLIVRVWPDGTGIGGNRGRSFGFDLFKKTIAGLALVVQETGKLLNGLLLLRFPGINSR